VRKFYEALLDNLVELHAEILKALDELPPEALDWVPGPEMNSLAVLIMHLTGAERYWVGDVVKGDPSFRNRDAEFRAKGVDAAALRQRIADLDLYEAGAFDTLDVSDLEQMRVSPRDGKEYSVSWALLHALQHTSEHVGHIQILRQQWKQRAKT
jgi:uncharacterized damage-inducible protein DinB